MPTRAQLKKAGKVAASFGLVVVAIVAVVTDHVVFDYATAIVTAAMGISLSFKWMS